jgi:hypothetical protein
MLGQVISKSIRAFVSKDGFATSKALPFGTIVFVVSLGPAGEAKIIHEDMIYRVPASSLEFLKSEKDILSWEDIERAIMFSMSSG